MLVELQVAEQRLRAVWEVLDGASVTEVARRFKVSRQSVHAWLRRYAADQGLGDWSSRPQSCPHQMSPATEARIDYRAWEDTVMVSTITTGSKILAMGDFRYFVIVDGNRHGY